MRINQGINQKPRERLREKGVAYLGDAELVAVLLGTGVQGMDTCQLAQRLLDKIGGVTGLAAQGLGGLCQVRGMGNAKAARLLAAVELGARVIERRSVEKGFNRFTCSRDIFRRYHARLCRLKQEVFLVVGLNNKNEVIHEVIVAMGSVDECRVIPREVYRPLIMEAAARTIMLHNHPSGDPQPSPEDIALTQRLWRVGELLGISMLDHLVIGNDSYCSFRDMGLLQFTTE
ncbi:MAG: DNA repair protein RadC [Deltaproteobacteria bacterium]|nr:DNA repair protein RadC [Deltaproteobacteria bacterium]MBN2671786.1 DNA repair protein RadC [Deltaproteobacteria bacterium]